jgi:hypothetical protein
MSITKLTLEHLKFPAFAPDDESKKNFRLFLRMYAVNAKGDPEEIIAVLPEGIKDWQWHKGSKSNFVPNDGAGLIHVGEIPEASRIILWEKGLRIHLLEVKLLDVKNGNAWDKIQVVLKELADLGMDAITNLSFPGAAVVRFLSDTPLKAEAKEKLDELIGKIGGSGDKVFAAFSFKHTTDFIPEGPIKLRKTNSGGNYAGSYEVDLELDILDV